MSTKCQATCDVCGHTTTSKTQGLAEYGLRKHNCVKQQAKQQRAADHAARMAKVDRTPKPCHHKQARHVHGTHVCYIADRCRCRPCADANTAYERNRTRQHAYGRFDQKWIPADQTRAHIETVRAAGMGLRTLSKRSGVAESTLGKIVYGDPSRGRGPTKRIRHDTAAKILAVTPSLNLLADSAPIDGTGTRRRLQALAANGWSQPRLAALIGWETNNLNALIRARRSRVEASTARAVTRLYEQLWDQQPPATNRWQTAGITRVKKNARANGWAVPMAWDDETIDDPAARPHGRTYREHRSATDLVAEVEHHLTHVDRLATSQQIAERLGYTDRTGVQHGLERAGRQDLLDLLRRNAELITGADGLHGNDRDHRTNRRQNGTAA